MVAHVVHSYPYWNASLGADHFYICAHDMGTRVTGASNQNLLRNAIALVNTADILERTFLVHKDISVPPHPGRGTVLWSEMGLGGASFDPGKRVRLAFIAGNLSRYSSANTCVNMCLWGCLWMCLWMLCLLSVYYVYLACARIHVQTFGCTPPRGPVRPKLLQLFGHDSDFLVVDGHMSDHDYLK